MRCWHLTLLVNSSWDGWCGGGKSTATISGPRLLDAGWYEYKFAYDSWTGRQTLTPGGTVTTDIFTNRFYQCSEDTELGVVCWES